jgi:hypothetical protein
MEENLLNVRRKIILRIYGPTDDPNGLGKGNRLQSGLCLASPHKNYKKCI